MNKLTIKLRPVIEADVQLFQRFVTEPGLIGLDWRGYRDAGAAARRLAKDGYLAEDNGRLMVEIHNKQVAGFVNWTAVQWGGSDCWEIGNLFAHTTVQRIQATTHPNKVAEQKSLENAGFQREGVVRAAAFLAGQWCDAWLYSRLRHDPAPSESEGIPGRPTATMVGRDKPDG